ncbi:MAG: putative Zn-dependent protease [Limisphaerales bacterium]|jgi:predicted Zn-dependent protease
MTSCMTIFFSSAKSRIFINFILALLLIVFGISCQEDGGGFNIFSVQDDIDLGLQLSDEINADPSTYPVLSELGYPDAYGHINRITNEILDNAPISYRTQFPWDVKIIHDDDVLNAFCTPGGYIYVYTGLIKFLDSEDELAGVMGHEIAHADLRHTTDQLTQQYGISLLLGLLLGENQSQLTDIAAGLAVLKFSRNHEEQSDEYSVIYLCETEYDARGASRFFEKLEAAGGSTVPEFLSTHPDPANRVDDIQAKWLELGCGEGGTFEARYSDFKATLP